MAMSGAAPGQGKAAGIPIEVIEDLKERFKGFPVPQPPFSPATATPEQLTQYGLPPRPNPSTPALLRQVWDRGFGAPLTLREFELDARAVRETVYRPQTREAIALTGEETRFETSANWSGAYITANRGKQFLQIWGLWTIPGNLKLPPPPYRGPPGIDYICSNWIGLDGQRFYLDSSLPQIGTACQLQPDGTTTAQAWTQWWARYSNSNVPVPLNLAVAPGNLVLSVLTAMDPRTVILVMVNLTTLEAKAVEATPPTVKLPDGNMATPEIAGATAEWIVERPAIPNEPVRDNFPDYGQTEFDFCVAVEGDSVNILSLFTGAPQVLQGERLIRMFDVLQNPQRTAFISMPRKLDNTSVRLRYGGFPG
jgi:hypothetical protein